MKKTYFWTTTQKYVTEDVRRTQARTSKLRSDTQPRVAPFCVLWQDNTLGGQGGALPLQVDFTKSKV